MSHLRDPQKHDDLLNYQLKRLFSIGGAPAVRLCEGRYGVTRHEWRLIAALVEDGPMTPTDLTHRCYPIEPGQVSRNISGLRAKDLVRRLQAAPVKGQRPSIEATDAGKRLYAELFPQLVGINRRIMAALDAQEAVLLEAFLSRLTERAQQIHDAGDGVDARADRRLGGSRRFWN